MQGLSLNTACKKICEEGGLNFDYFYSRLIQLKPKTFGEVKHLIMDIYARNIGTDLGLMYDSEPCLATIFRIKESASKLGIDWIRDAMQERINNILKTQNEIAI